MSDYSLAFFGNKKWLDDTIVELAPLIFKYRITGYKHRGEMGFSIYLPNGFGTIIIDAEWEEISLSTSDTRLSIEDVKKMIISSIHKNFL